MLIRPIPPCVRKKEFLISISSVSVLIHVDLRHIALDQAETDIYRPDYDPLPRNPSAILDFPDASLDLFVVDGWYRLICARAALPKLKPGGLLLIDNTDWNDPPHIHVPTDWPLVHERRNVMTRASIWWKPDNQASTNQHD